MNDILMTIDPKDRDLGGFHVRRILPFAKKRMVGPFIFLDEMGPVELKPGEGIDVRAHPHIGLSTLTYLFEGQLLHRDSLNNEIVIKPGEVNWMTAGSGIVHSERSPKKERSSIQKLHGLQSWIALPEKDEDTSPNFTNYKVSDLPKITEFKNLEIVLIAGEAFRYKSPVSVYSKMFYMDVLSTQKSLFEMDPQDQELAVYVVDGQIEIDNQVFNKSQFIIFKESSQIKVHLDTQTRMMVLGGEKFKEEKHIWWNLVSSNKEKIESAKKKWQNNEFPSVINETEKIPLP